MALDEDFLRAVDEYVADGQVAKQRLYWTESGDLVENLLDDALTVCQCERCGLLSKELRDDFANLGIDDTLIGDPLECLEIESLDELSMQIDLDTIDCGEDFVLDPSAIHAGRHRRDRSPRRQRWPRLGGGDGNGHGSLDRRAPVSLGETISK